ncbi:hypothetical protein [Arthrobacter sp. 9MFCol3.1]|uniref:hypothetical protein n=1 Tax=Arthrobacter sp. 9MFCol3.1 TaxID=1150398 RepID=UPI0012DEACE4|nr:hypothetical protein [Arthrobacter sp. 9MFCol3.1]
MILDELWDHKRVPAILQAIADSLATSGIRGHLRSCGTARLGPGGLQDYACWTAAFSPVGSRWLRPAPAGRERRVGDLQWRIEQDALDKILGHALKWCTVEGGTDYFGMGMHRFKCLPEERRGLFSAAYRARGEASIISFDGLQKVRKVDFSLEGYVMYQQRDISLTREKSVRDMTQVLVHLADELQYGLVKGGNWMSGTFGPLLDTNWPEFEGPHGWMRQAHPVLDRYVPDAYGVQVLGPLHDRSLFPPDWILSPAGVDRVLTVHPDFDAWFGRDHPDAQLVESGRECLSGMLFTQALGMELNRETFP